MSKALRGNIGELDDLNTLAAPQFITRLESIVKFSTTTKIRLSSMNAIMLSLAGAMLLLSLLATGCSAEEHLAEIDERASDSTKGANQGSPSANQGSPSADQGSPSAEKTLQRFASSKLLMGVEFEVIVYAPGEQEAKDAIAAAFARIAALEKIFSDYDSSSESLRLAENAPHAHPQQVSADLHFLLTRSIELNRLSHGAFDPTMGPLTKIWRRARRQSELPAVAELDTARQAVGMNFVQLLPPDKVQLLHAIMRLDFGGIAKGYAAEQALAVLKKQGHPHALVRGSGDMAAGDAPPDADGWVVGIAPLDPTQPVQHTVTIANQCVSTSGDARQHLVVDGHRYSHIIDPRTGKPVEGRSSVTVIAPHGWQSDGLATAFSVLKPEESLALARSLEGIATLMIVEQDGKQTAHASENWKMTDVEPETKPK